MPFSDPDPQNPGGIDTFRLPDSPILTSFVSLGGGTLIARAIAFVGTAFLTRTLGPYGFGIIGFAFAICNYFAMAVRASVAPVGSREVARHPDQIAAMVKGVIVVRTAVALICIGCVLVIVALIDKPQQVKAVVALTGLTMISQALTIGWVYKGLGRNRMVGTGLIVEQLVYVAVLLVTVRAPSDVVWVPIAVVLGQLATAAVLGIPILWGSNAKIDVTEGLRILLASRFVAGARLLTHLILTVDVVLLGLLVGEFDVGLYSASYRLGFLVLGLGVALNTAYLPRLARAAQAGIEPSSRMVARALESAWTLALPLVAGGIICAQSLLATLFGADYAQGSIAFRFLLLAVGLQFGHGLANMILLVFEKTRADMRLRGVASLINIALNLWWIPRWGIAGAAAATLASHIVISSLSAWVCGRIGIRLPKFAWWKAVAATGIMTLWLVLVASSWHVLIQTTSGGLVYLACLALLQGIPTDLHYRRHSIDRAGS